MAKDKRKRKYFQGMEHLKHEVEDVSDHSIMPGLDDQQPSLERSLLRKDLIFIILLMSLFFLVLVGLMVLDKNSDYLSVLAEKISSLLIK